MIDESEKEERLVFAKLSKLARWHEALLDAERENLVKKAKLDTFRNSLEIGSNISILPEDMKSAMMLVAQNTKMYIAAVKIMLTAVVRPSFEPESWGPYALRNSYPDDPDEWTEEINNRYERDPWAQWKGRTYGLHLGFGHPKSSDPKPIREKLPFWFFGPSAKKPEDINPIIVESVLHTIGYEDAFAESPNWVRVRQAFSGEINNVENDSKVSHKSMAENPSLVRQAETILRREAKR